MFPESGAILFESYRRALLKRSRTGPCTSLTATGSNCSPLITNYAQRPRDRSFIASGDHQESVRRSLTGPRARVSMIAAALGGHRL